MPRASSGEAQRAGRAGARPWGPRRARLAEQQDAVAVHDGVAGHVADPGRHGGQRRAHRQRQPPEPGVHQVVAHQLRARPSPPGHGGWAARAQAREGQAAQDASRLFDRTSACDRCCAMLHVTDATAPGRSVRMRLAPVSREHCLKTVSNQICCRAPTRALRPPAYQNAPSRFVVTGAGVRTTRVRPGASGTA